MVSSSTTVLGISWWRKTILNWKVRGFTWGDLHRKVSPPPPYPHKSVGKGQTTKVRMNITKTTFRALDPRHSLLPRVVLSKQNREILGLHSYISCMLKILFFISLYEYVDN